MDLSIDLGGYKLNIRATGIIIHDNKLLVHKNANSDHYALIGGRITIGENSEDAIKREVLEELGKEVEIIQYIGIVENFFTVQDLNYHEIMFIYELEFKEEDHKLINYTLKNIEGKDNLKYEWLDINKLDDIPLRPYVVKDIIKKNKFPIHKIHNEII